MMKEEKGKWEDIIRSKMYDFEADTNPDDWDVISDKLSGGKTVVFKPYRKYAYTVAAAVAALLIIGGLYFYSSVDKGADTLATTGKSITEVVDEMTENTGAIAGQPVEHMGEPVEKPVEKVVDKPVDKLSDKLIGRTEENLIATSKSVTTTYDMDILKQQLLNNDNAAKILKIPEVNMDAIEKGMLYGYNEIKPEPVALDKSHVAEVAPKAKNRRWGFGMGGGSYTVGSTAGASNVAPYSTALDYDEYILGDNIITLRNSETLPLRSDVPDKIRETSLYNNKGKASHKMPISAGIGVSYYLNDRLALQSGLTYTLLRSEGDFYDDVIGNMVNWKQNLHFIGIPLSLSYKIAEWNRFQFYASAGGMTEFNVAGKLKNTVVVEGMKVTETENKHMDAPLWSVNARGGVVYPLWKFINFYAEAGASYYFKNNSKIETIRSDKPFNVSLQAGIRLGF